jgi:hypothetical protein
VQNYEFYLTIKKKSACFIWFSRVYLVAKDNLSFFTVIFIVNDKQYPFFDVLFGQKSWYDVVACFMGLSRPTTRAAATFRVI